MVQQRLQSCVHCAGNILSFSELGSSIIHRRKEVKPKPRVEKEPPLIILYPNGNPQKDRFMALTAWAKPESKAAAPQPQSRRLMQGLMWLGQRAQAWQHACLKEVPLSPRVVPLRQQAAQLLDGVLEDTLTPRQAINRWPAPQGVDKSLDVAFLALAHLEADHYDEDKIQQRLDPYYLDAQLAWLQQLWEWLSQGETVPEAFWSEYQKTRHTTGWYTEPVIGFKPLWQSCQILKLNLATWRNIVLQR